MPRLIAAGADLALVFRADVTTAGDAEVSLTLPVDCASLEAAIVRVEAALVSLDPLMSSIAAGIDSHKDAEVRTALEPLGRLADRTGCTVLGNAHFNKSTGADPMALVMGSAAFGNVVRAALGFARDSDSDGGGCVISQVKNNLGRLDLPSLSYVIEEALIDTAEGPAAVGKLVMRGESARSVGDILQDRADGPGRGERDEAADWLVDFLTAASGEAAAADVIKAATRDGIAKTTLHRARQRAGVTSAKAAMSGGWVWSLPRRIHEGSEDSRSPRLEPSEPSVEPSGDLADASPTEIGPCGRCGNPCRRYGPAAEGALCRTCRAAS